MRRLGASWRCCETVEIRSRRGEREGWRGFWHSVDFDGLRPRRVDNEIVSARDAGGKCKVWRDVGRGRSGRVAMAVAVAIALWRDRGVEQDEGGRFGAVVEFGRRGGGGGTIGGGRRRGCANGRGTGDCWARLGTVCSRGSDGFGGKWPERLRLDVYRKRYFAADVTLVVRTY